MSKQISIRINDKTEQALQQLTAKYECCSYRQNTIIQTAILHLAQQPDKDIRAALLSTRSLDGRMR